MTWAGRFVSVKGPPVSFALPGLGGAASIERDRKGESSMPRA